MKSETLLESLYAKLAQFSKEPGELPENESPKRLSSIVKSLDHFIKSLEDRCAVVATEVPKLALDVQTALGDALDTNKLFRSAIISFMVDPMDNMKCDEVGRTGTALLSSISRILILCEFGDSCEFAQVVTDAEEAMVRIMSAPSSKELLDLWDIFSARITRIIEHLDQSSAELSSRGYYEQFTRIHYILSNNNRLLFTACKAYLHHPDLAATQSTKQFAFASLSDALNGVHTLLNEPERRDGIRLPVCGTLLNELESFEATFTTEISNPDEESFRKRIDSQLRRLLPMVYRIVDNPRTLPMHRDYVCATCAQLEQSVTIFLNEYSQQPLDQSTLNVASQTLLDEIGRLKPMLVRIVAGRAIQAMVIRDQPLMSLSDATKFGNQYRMDSALEAFQEHSGFMVAAGYDLCSMTANQSAAECVHLACSQLEQLCPQLVSCAYLVFGHPHSRTVDSNFEAFRKAHENATKLLNASICDLVGLYEFLSIIDQEMHWDLNHALKALSEDHEALVNEASSSMHYRSNQLYDVVANKLSSDDVDPVFSNQLLEKLTLIRSEFVPTFVEISRDTFSHLAAHQTADKERFRNAGINLCSAVHGLRGAELWGREPSPEPELFDVNDDSDESSVQDDSPLLVEPDLPFPTAPSPNENATGSISPSTFDGISLHDYLSIVDQEMNRDLDRVLNALSENQEAVVLDASSSMQSRLKQLYEVVSRKLNSDDTDPVFANRILGKLTLIGDEIGPAFLEVLRDTLISLAAHQTVAIEPFQNAAVCLCSAIHELLDAELWGRELSPEPETFELDDRKNVTFEEQEVQNEEYDQFPVDEIHADDDSSGFDLPAVTPPPNDSSMTDENHPAIFDMLSNTDQAAISKEVASFVEEKKLLMSEVVQWDESGNEVVSLSKRMSVIMMDLADFVYGRGPLSTVDDVIKTAQRISEMGQRLCHLCQEIANMCPESSNRRDLLVYLERVSLYCHQLKITSRVKAGFDETSSPLVESATTLIQTARNLMKAVFATVKESYIASTKFLSSTNQPIVLWKMKKPEKKPITEDQANDRSRRRRRPTQRHITGIELLSEFKTSTTNND